MNPDNTGSASPTAAVARSTETISPVADALPVGASRAGGSVAIEPVDRIAQEFQNVQRAFGFYAAMLLPLLIAVGWVYHTQRNAIGIQFWASGALYLIIAVFAVCWRCDWWHLARLPSGVSNGWLVIGALSPLVSIGAAHLLVEWAAGIGLPVQDMMAGYGADAYPVWLLAVELIVLAPVFEELAFRGVLMAKLERVMSPTQAIWVTAILFGVLHFSTLSMAVFLVPLGAIAGYLTRETKSLIPAIAIHAAHNAGVLLLSCG